MKKFLILALFVLVFAVLVSPAFALDCKNGNYGSDECWTNVRVSPLEDHPVSIGTVLVYDVSAGPLTTDDGGAFQVRVLTNAYSSIDGYRVAGIAQKVIATGDRGNVLVRGLGKARVSSNITSGDRLYVADDPLVDGVLGKRPGTLAGEGISTDKVIAWGANTQTAATCAGAAACDVYVTVI